MSAYDYVLSKKRSDYQRDNFDDFLHHVKLKYDVPSIHIAGTNGKGSTANYLASIYQNAGYKVGLFTSPYTNQFNEMIQVNGAMIQNEQIEAIIDDYQKEIDRFDLSAFEIQTFLALTHFQNEKCDIAIIECGMGGELDATNIFDPILAIITSISLEHTAYLGRSLIEIAEQKAGIIKMNTPALISKLNEDVTTLIANICKKNKSKLYVVDDCHFFIPGQDGSTFTYSPYSNLRIRSLAQYSAYDACLAVEAIKILQSQFPVQEKNIREGLMMKPYSLRLEKLMDKPALYIDGGHNPEAIEQLSKSMQKIQNGHPIHVIFACFRDKNLQKMLEELSLLSDDISLTTFVHPRARNEEEYFLFLDEYQFYDDPVSLVNQKLKEYPDDIVLVCGSLAFVGFIKNQYVKGLIQYEQD